MFSVHHIAIDVTALSQLFEHVFAIYQADIEGKARAAFAGLQLGDVADALARWNTTPHGANMSSEMA